LECKDPNCPIHGSLKTHGDKIEGVVVSDKARKTAIVEQTYTTFLKKYSRSLRNNSRIPAYNPDCLHAKVGDKVIIEACRRLSKTKSFVITQVLERAKP